ncbi:uncharacterized protein ColSpa_02782 [Colletotrichum spaethianum]|uniref:Uncharacterized protein n=1 Tax=Colletotrichum spaethianum TaxID=700344 RepID=A0AA37L6C7_9PEZI|nr:uncharacterized protein ColSpa_02782 [Colletotrichum spaethianum]GKT42601.1 hypothetical protein ColSpa_02782 [Colletotrichum spaethianum]
MPFPVLSKEPIPGLALSASGLVALADLQTIANRTALTGTSSWFDALVLAPGLHYQQAADGVAGNSSAVAAETSAAFGFGGSGRRSSGTAGLFGTQALPGGKRKDVRVTNPGMLLFLSRLGVQEERAREREMKKEKAGGGGVEAFGIGAGGGEKVITLDVGTLGHRKRRRGRAFSHDADWQFERASNLLYLASPVLTLAALIIMILLADWWGLAAILALIASRILNIYIIKQRTPPPPPPAPRSLAATTPSYTKLSEYLIPLTPTLKVRMRGPASDLAALTTDAWLLSKTAVQGYLEATAKLVVYMVAIFSGNISQAGNLVLLILLLGSAGLLGLSNGFVKGVKGKGRVARVWNEEVRDEGANGTRGRRKQEGDGVDVAEWDAQVGRIIRDPYPFEGEVEYS